MLGCEDVVDLGDEALVEFAECFFVVVLIVFAASEAEAAAGELLDGVLLHGLGAEAGADGVGFAKELLLEIGEGLPLLVGEIVALEGGAEATRSGVVAVDRGEGGFVVDTLEDDATLLGELVGDLAFVADIDVADGVDEFGDAVHTAVHELAIPAAAFAHLLHRFHASGHVVLGGAFEVAELGVQLAAVLIEKGSKALDLNVVDLGGFDGFFDIDGDARHGAVLGGRFVVEGVAVVAALVAFPSVLLIGGEDELGVVDEVFADVLAAVDELAETVEEVEPDGLVAFGGGFVASVLLDGIHDLGDAAELGLGFVLKGLDQLELSLVEIDDSFHHADRAFRDRRAVGEREHLPLRRGGRREGEEGDGESDETPAEGGASLDDEG